MQKFSHLYYHCGNAAPFFKSPLVSCSVVFWLRRLFLFFPDAPSMVEDTQLACLVDSSQFTLWEKLLVKHKYSSTRKEYYRNLMYFYWVFSPWYLPNRRGRSGDILSKRNSVSSRYPNREKRDENTTCSRVFLTKFEVFGWPMKYCLECLIYVLNRNKN